VEGSIMSRTRIALLAMVAALGGGSVGFKTRTAPLQQKTVELNIPRAYGTYKGNDGGHYLFEAPDGTIRTLIWQQSSGQPPILIVQVILHRT
jgi:hypothetical protein